MLSAVIQNKCSYPAMPLAGQLDYQRFTHPGPFVLGTDSRRSPAPTVDKDRTVLRRSEPSSRTTLIGEQPNPWDLLQPQDVMSRHRGAFPNSLRIPLGTSVTILEATAPVKLPA